MSQQNKEVHYTKEELLKMTPTELVKLIQNLVDEVHSLRFMLDEFYNAEKSMVKNIETEFKRMIAENYTIDGDDTEH